MSNRSIKQILRRVRCSFFRACAVGLCFCCLMAASVLHAAPPTPEESRRAAEENRRNVEEAKRRSLAIRQQFRDKSLCLAGTDTAYSVLERLYAAFRKDREDVPMYLDYTGGGDRVGVRELTSGQAGAIVVREVLKDREKKLLAEAFPDPKSQPSTVEFGRLVLFMVVHKS